MDERSDLADLADGSIGGSGFTGTGRPSRTFPRGRVCGHDGCETRLSIYNDSSYCSSHQPQVAPRMRGRKIA
ncbi:MAG: hypothetical protein KGJ77_03765 [Acidobacteriota bacterium]|nr:hypothetical protein [Acidobacteriota bacterium]